MKHNVMRWSLFLSCLAIFNFAIIFPAHGHGFNHAHTVQHECSLCKITSHEGKDVPHHGFYLLRFHGGGAFFSLTLEKFSDLNVLLFQQARSPPLL